MFRKADWRDFALTAIAILLCWIRLAHHEVWRDEVNVWGIALASRSLPDLFHKLHYEGHPSLWYLLLWCVSRFTGSFLAMKFAEGAIAAGIYVVIGLCSPFSRLERVLLFCSYYVFFEYTILSRTYGLCFLLLLLFLVFRFRYPEKITLNLFLLGLVANAEMLGLMLGLLLACEYVWDRRRGKTPVREFSPGVVLFLACIAGACMSVIPAHDLSYRTAGRYLLAHVSQAAMLLGALVANVVMPWFPLKLTYPRAYWNATPSDWLGYLVLMPVLLATYWFAFQRRRNLLLVIAGSVAASTAFSFLIYFGSVRNFGIVFLAFLFAIWSMRAAGAPVPKVAIVLLVISGVQGIAAAAGDYHHPFSNAGPAARWLTVNHMTGAQLVGTPDTSLAGLAEQLGKPAYFLDCNCSDTYLAFSSRRDQFREAQIPQRIETAAQLFAGSKTVLVLGDPLTAHEIAALRANGVIVRNLASFGGAEAWQENFYLYSLSQAPTELSAGAADSSAGHAGRPLGRRSPLRPPRG